MRRTAGAIPSRTCSNDRGPSRSPSSAQASTTLPDFCARPEIVELPSAGRCPSPPELAQGARLGVLVLVVLALGDRPRSGVLLGPERPARMTSSTSTSVCADKAGSRHPVWPRSQIHGSRPIELRDRAARRRRHRPPLAAHPARSSRSSRAGRSTPGRQRADGGDVRGRGRGPPLVPRRRRRRRSSWLYGIARHQLSNWYRRASVERRALAKLRPGSRPA